MRKTYIDNIRWMTVVAVVIYHMLYMFNGVVTGGVIGPFAPVQYQDAFLYSLYPWFMLLLFVVSGMSARFYLNEHSDKEYRKSRTTKLRKTAVKFLPGHVLRIIFPPQLVKVNDRQAQPLPQNPGKSAFSTARAADNQDSFHGSPFALCQFRRRRKK